MPLVKNYQVFRDGTPLSLKEMRVSRFPFNRHWPGFQRPLDQTEVTGFASFELTGKTEIRIDCEFDFEEVVVRPLSLGIIPQRNGRTVTLLFTKPCQAVVEFDGISGALHLFADPPEKPFTKDAKTLYFGPGELHPGRMTLTSGQTVYLHRDAVVYGEIFACDAENIRIWGRGILDHSEAQPDAVTDGFVDPARPSPIELRYCKNVELSGIIVRDPCFLAVRPICCENVLIDTIKVIGCWRYNSDGIDLINSRHCRINNCFVRSFDDSYCIKGFCAFYRDEQEHNGKRYDCTQDVVFRNCVAFGGWGKTLEVGVDLCAEEIKDCAFEDCDVIHAVYAAMDISNVDYADVHDIAFRNIRVELDASHQPPIIQEREEDTYPGESAEYLPYLMIAAVYFSEDYSFPGPKRGKIHDITFDQIQVTAGTMPPLFSGDIMRNTACGISP